MVQIIILSGHLADDLKPPDRSGAPDAATLRHFCQRLSAVMVLVTFVAALYGEHMSASGERRRRGRFAGLVQPVSGRALTRAAGRRPRRVSSAFIERLIETDLLGDMLPGWAQLVVSSFHMAR